MLNRFARFLMVVTSIAPILGSIGIYQLALARPWYCWVPLLVVAALLVILYWLLLKYSAKNIQKDTLKIKRYKRYDGFWIYLLVYSPLLLTPSLLVGNYIPSARWWITVAYIFTMVFVAIANTAMSRFNPVMGLLGYHLYKVRDVRGAPYLLISKNRLISRKHLIREKERFPSFKTVLNPWPAVDITAVRLTQNVYLYTEEGDIFINKP
jgi:hypothetical protein